MTRYPKAGKGSKWTIRELNAIPPEWHGDTLADGNGLYGEVRFSKKGSASVRFKYAFRWEGKTRWYQLGTYPGVGVAEIRAERDRARQLVAEGVNPVDSKKADKIEAQAAVSAVIAEAERQATENLTVADMFSDWLRKGVARQDGNAELTRSFNKDVLSVIGQKAIRDLTDNDLLDVLGRVRKRGVNRTVVILNNDIGQMLRWAEKRQPWRGLMIDGNPADLIDVETLLDPDYEEERDRILSPAEIRELRDILARLEMDYKALPAGQKYSGIRPVNKRVQCALWICLSTICRIGELLQAEWRHIDLDVGTWFIPASNTKGKRGKRKDHHVFLSPFAISHFRKLQIETGHTPFCFPSPKGDNHVGEKTVSKLIGDRQCRFKKRSKPPKGRHHNDTLVLSDGANGEWTPHDLRRTGATMMQALGVTLDVIDRCQNHVMPGKVRRHYLHHDYAEEKTKAWRLLGEHIETILKADNVVMIGKRA
ncbi:integrase [Pseudomonas sp. WN033]|nr:integrase [Pseudomonas sp. WN033]